MKKLVILFLIMAASVQAQDGKHEKIKALKTAYITEQLALTPSEAEKFWPIYNGYYDKFHALRMKERTEIYEKLRNGLSDLTNSEANDLIDKNLAIESEELDLRRQMTAELRKIISPKKIISLKKAEDDFKRELFERYRQSNGKRKE